MGQTNNLFMEKETDHNEIKRGFVLTTKIQADDEISEILKKRYIAFDVETTGLSAVKDRIIEIGAVLFENGKIVNTYGTLVDPLVSVPYSASAINHITDDMLKDAPKEDEVYSGLVEFLGDALKQKTIICAHNASFDMNFLSQTLARLGYNGKIRYTDTLQLSRRLIKGLYNYRQDTVAAYFDLINERSHRAVTDAQICGKILWKLLEIKETTGE